MILHIFMSEEVSFWHLFLRNTEYKTQQSIYEWGTFHVFISTTKDYSRNVFYNFMPIIRFVSQIIVDLVLHS